MVIKIDLMALFFEKIGFYLIKIKQNDNRISRQINRC
jgi:hypothetical protein